jgi:hypothetical protein
MVTVIRSSASRTAGSARTLDGSAHALAPTGACARSRRSHAAAEARQAALAISTRGLWRVTSADRMGELSD